MSDTPDATTPAPNQQPTPPAAQPAPPVAPAAPVVQVLPPENATRGTLLALVIVIGGVAAWSIISAIGFISGWIPLLICIGALALYRRGSGGRISYAGATRAAVVALVTIIVSFFAGPLIGDASGVMLRALGNGRLVQGALAWYGQGTGDFVINMLLIVAFTVLGIVAIYRTAAVQIKQQAAAEAAAPHTA